MKKVLSLIVAILIIASITVSASAAVTMYPYVFKAVHTDGVEYTFHFGTRDNTSEDVGIEINGKQYKAENFDTATNTQFGIGIADPDNKLGDVYTYKTFSGSSYGEETTIAKADILNWDEIPADEEEENNFEKGTFTYNAAYRIARKSTGLIYSKWSDAAGVQYNDTKISLDTNSNNKQYPEVELILQYTTDAEGLNKDDKIILTVYAHAYKSDTSEMDGKYIRLYGISEDYNHPGEKGSTSGLPTLDLNCVIDALTGPDKLTTQPQAFTFDVTDYVKSKITSDNKQISFAVSPFDTTETYSEFDIYINTKQPDYVPILEYTNR